MTTIVYRDGIMAGDSRITDDNIIFPGVDVKVYKSKSGWLYGACGDVSACELFYAWARKLRDLPKKAPNPLVGSFEGLIVSPRGVIMFVEGGRAWSLKADFAAVGSGRDAALGALHFGASAREAVECATKVDSKSGLPISSVSLK